METDVLTSRRNIQSRFFKAEVTLQILLNLAEKRNQITFEKKKNNQKIIRAIYWKVKDFRSFHFKLSVKLYRYLTQTAAHYSEILEDLWWNFKRTTYCNVILLQNTVWFKNTKQIFET